MGLQHPPSVPKTTARAIITHPGRVRDVRDLVLPEPHFEEETMNRPYLGLVTEPAGETQPTYVRLPLTILGLIRRIVEDRRMGYDGTNSSFIRHAVYELLWLHWQRDEGNVQESELIQYMRQQEALCLAAFEAERGLTQEKALRVIEASMARSIERGHLSAINTALRKLDSLLTGSLSETWTTEFKWLLSRSPVVHRAVSAIVTGWQESDEPKEQRIAEEWNTWFTNLERRDTSKLRRRRKS